MLKHTEFKCIEVIDEGVETAKEFLDILNPTNNIWGNEFKCPWIYRGQRDATWGLRPSAWRPECRQDLSPLISTLKPIALKRWEGSDVMKNEHALEAVTRTAAVFEITYQFCDLADELGYFVPESDKVCRGKEFIDKGHWPGHWLRPGFAPSQAFGFAQHHGLPTHLLDWTRNPYIAAFFAAESYQKWWPSSGNGNVGAGNFAVWAINLNGVATDARESNALVPFTCPRAQHGFLHSQDGLFLWHSRGDEHYQRSGNWPDFLEVIEKSYKEDTPRPVKKIVLNGTQAYHVLEDLRRLRISRAHLMPTYDNIAKQVLSILLPLSLVIRNYLPT